MATNKVYDVTEVGVFTPKLLPIDEIKCRRCWIYNSIYQKCGDARVGDTVTEADRPTAEALPGYKKAVPMVYSGYISSRWCKI